MISMIDAKLLTVFVTGATSGFGTAIARRFAEAGSRVIATGRRQDRLDDLKKEIGDRCHIIRLDVRDREAVDAAVAALPEAFRAVNVAVANAGLALGLEPAHQTRMEDWETMVATNINGLLYTVRALLPGMVERDEGHVVLIGSVAADYPYPGGNVYGATKAFVKQFALNLRADLLGANVRVTNIEPGMAETEFSLVRFKGDAEKAAVPYRGLEPMSAEDIAETIFWSCTLPRHLNINRMQMMPLMQAFGPFAFKRD
ncbi:MAG: SDR family NAD(P)-dependent oxidoreductase [Xanthobacteraceae bacterium]|nr:SDR family NAD(P)-dependent oxidoreductase [Xanthobacteraceae bacterium]